MATPVGHLSAAGRIVKFARICVRRSSVRTALLRGSNSLGMLAWDAGALLKSGRALNVSGWTNRDWQVGNG
jgi:hypothetical protein